MTRRAPGKRAGDLAVTILSHVGVDQKIFESKITEAGFAKAGETTGFLMTCPLQKSPCLERHLDGRVFRAALGGILRPDNARDMLIRQVIAPLSETFPTPPGEIGFEATRFHSLRHYFCSQCFLSGASEGEIREWMGHRDSKIVEHYRHLRREDATRKMGQVMFLPDGPATGNEAG